MMKVLTLCLACLCASFVQERLQLLMQGYRSRATACEGTTSTTLTPGSPQKASKPRSSAQMTSASRITSQDDNKVSNDSGFAGPMKRVGCHEVTGLWLMKNEPDELSLQILQSKPNQTWHWDGA
jgi:hypothetical protein